LLENPLVTGTVEPNPGGEKPFLLVFRNSIGILAAVPVNTPEDGEAAVQRMFQTLALESLTPGTTSTRAAGTQE
jgi:hypothetical protein